MSRILCRLLTATFMAAVLSCAVPAEAQYFGGYYDLYDYGYVYDDEFGYYDRFYDDYYDVGDYDYAYWYGYPYSYTAPYYGYSTYYRYPYYGYAYSGYPYYAGWYGWGW